MAGKGSYSLPNAASVCSIERSTMDCVNWSVLCYRNDTFSKTQSTERARIMRFPSWVIIVALLVPNVLAAQVASSAATPAMVLTTDGTIVLSDGRPLTAYRADRSLHDACIARAEATKQQWLDQGEEPSYTYYGFLHDARSLQTEVPELRAIPVAELASLVWYCEFGYQMSNDELWSRTLPQDLDFKLQVSGLNGLPDYVGMVYRMDFYSDTGGHDTEGEVARRMAVYQKHLTDGTPFVFRGFMSATRGQGAEIRHALATKNMVVLEIASKRGKAIESMSSRPEEEEVLFLPGTRFRIDEITVQPADVTVYNELGRSYRVAMTELP